MAAEEGGERPMEEPAAAEDAAGEDPDAGSAFLTGVESLNLNATAMPDPEPQPEEPLSGRGGQLLVEAQVRAEQQAAARLTMLELANALEASGKARRALEAQLAEERQNSSSLRNERERLLKELDEALRVSGRIEKAECRKKLEEGTKTGCFTAAAVLWSRQVFGLGKLDGGSVSPAELDEELSDPDMTPRQFAKPNGRTKGDGITLLWIVKSWKEQVEEGRVRRAKEAAEKERLRLIAEEVAKVRAEFETKLEGERKRNKAMEERIKQLLEELAEVQKRLAILEAERSNLMKKAEKGSDEVQKALEELQRKYAEMQQLLADKDARIAELEKALKDMGDDFSRFRDKAEQEKLSLKAEIRNLAQELQRTVIFAKHLRDIALKAKRDAAGSVSPEKFAQLIAELEDMRDRLTTLGRESEAEREKAMMFGLQLDKNQRRLELERQFLPLLHKVRGPVGPKNPTVANKKDSSWQANAAPATLVPINLGVAAGDTLAAGKANATLRASQSAGYLDTMKSQSRQSGQPLGAAF